MAHSFHNLLAHIIFSTKDCYPFIDATLAAQLHPYLGGIVPELNGTALAIGGMPDHVHLLVKLPATIAIADALRIIKTNSSKWVHDTQTEHAKFGWQTGYSAFSVSHSNIEDVSTYIQRQEKHHRRQAFQDEYLAFLKKNGIEYDERYVWE